MSATSAERATRLLVVATILATIGLIAALPGARAGVGWVVPRFAQGTPETGDQTAGEAIQHPTGAGEAIIRIENVGGLMPPEALVRELPSFVLYGDGLVVYPGRSLMVEPPAALPNLRQLRVNEAGIQAILEAAATARLIGEDRSFSNDLIMDAGTTVFTVTAGDRVTRTSVYALGIELGPNMPADERVAVETIDAFFRLLFDLPSWLPEGSIVEADAPFVVERLQVVTQPASADGESSGTATWPLATPLAEFGEPFAGIPSMFESMFEFEDARCATVEGDEAATLLAALAAANRYTRWESDGELFFLYPRPLLPDEAGCPPRQIGTATPAA
jgi:hypothetical protein